MVYFVSGEMLLGICYIEDVSVACCGTGKIPSWCVCMFWVALSLDGFGAEIEPTAFCGGIEPADKITTQSITPRRPNT